MKGGICTPVADESLDQRCLRSLHERIGTQRFNAWFKQGTRLSVQADLVKVSAPNSFVAGWIEKHYQGQIALAGSSLDGVERRVVCTVDASLSGEMAKGHLDTQAQFVQRATEGVSRPRHTTAGPALRHHLEDFVAGDSNRMALAAAQAAAQSVAQTGKAIFNPLFIWGPCGVGKTHLLQGICNSVASSLRDGKPVNWRYVTAEQFTNEFIGALRQKKLGEFRASYRALDMLAIDDVHFLTSKKATQEEFLHTYNTIESSGKQIVLASDAHPRLVGDLNEQLVSRFVAGMVVKVDAPDEATRMEILRRRVRHMKLHLGNDVLEFVAAHIRTSVRELEGAVIKLGALASLANGPVTLQMARDALSDHLARTGSALTLSDIEASVSTFFGITPADIHSSRRTKTVSAARMLAMFLARRHTQMSYPEIGTFMGKNHSSAVLAVQRMEHLLAKGQEVKWNAPAGPKAMKAAQLVELMTKDFPQ
jgi:chromosomal replication initiator protein